MFAKVANQIFQSIHMSLDCFTNSSWNLAKTLIDIAEYEMCTRNYMRIIVGIKWDSKFSENVILKWFYKDMFLLRAYKVGP